MYMNEVMPHVLNQLTLSPKLMMNFSWKIMHQDAFVLMNGLASHCSVNYVFANTFRLKVKKGSSTLV